MSFVKFLIQYLREIQHSIVFRINISTKEGLFIIGEGLLKEVFIKRMQRREEDGI